MKLSAIASFSVLLFMAAPAAVAEVKLSGQFTAGKACPALQSIKKGTNPGNVMVTTGQNYTVFAKNNEPASHYFIEVPGAQPSRRWVAVDCGTVNGEAQAAPAPGSGKVTSPPSGTQVEVAGNLYVLALSWEPAFCEGLPGKPECKAATAQSYDSTHLSLHGLWPQPRRRAFCNVDRAVAQADDEHRWEDLPEVKLSRETRAELDKVMPGTQSLLERHEWIKHGTCYPGADAEQYFKDSLRVTGDINASPVRALLAGRIGKQVTGTEVRAAFDAAYGTGAGERVRLACKSDGDRQLLVEITVGLRGNISNGTPLAKLIQAASPTDAGCPAGIVDPVGLQ